MTCSSRIVHKDKTVVDIVEICPYPAKCITPNKTDYATTYKLLSNIVYEVEEATGSFCMLSVDLNKYCDDNGKHTVADNTA